MSSYEEVIQKDLELLWVIQEYCYRTPWLNNLMKSIISKNPMKDIVNILWIFFIYGCIEFNHKHFWIVVLNAAFSFVARLVIEAKRPVEYDIRLQPLTDVAAESYGFPSLESYMSIIIIGDLLLLHKSFLLVPFGLLVVAVLGFSRVYSRSRFPHQIVGSWILGIFGLVIGIDICERMNFDKMTKHHHGFYVAIAVAIFICHLAFKMENNDSYLLYVPKKEFTKVISDILSGPNKSEASVIDDSNNYDDDDDKFYDVTNNENNTNTNNMNSYRRNQRTSSNRNNLSRVIAESPRTIETKRLQASNSLQYLNEKLKVQNKRFVKSDSLYYLQKSMELRESTYKQSQDYNNMSSNYI